MNTPPKERLAWRVDEVAAALAVSHRAVYRAVAAGQLGSIRVGRHLRVPDAELQRLLSVGDSADEVAA